MWYRLITMQSYQLDRIAQKGVSKATGDQPRNSDDCIAVRKDTFADGINDLQNTYEKCRLNPPEYSQVAPIEEIKQQDWRNELKNIATDIVSKTNEVLLKTFTKHDQYTKRFKDLLDEEMAEMRRDLESLRPSQSDTVTPKATVTAPVTLGTSPVDRPAGWNDPITHQNRMDSSRWVLGTKGQPIFIPPVTEGTCANGSRKYKRQGSVNFKSGTFAEYEEFKRTMKNMSKVLDWDDNQFGKEVFLNISGKAAERINDMLTSDICNASKLFEKLDKTFLPKNYYQTVLEEFGSLEYKTGNKLSEFYEDMKPRPSVHSTIMEDYVTAQLCKTISPEVYAKCLSNFHLKGEDILGMMNLSED